MAEKLILIGLVQPKKDMVEAFNEWYLGNHIEDTFNCPVIKTARCYRATRGFLGKVPSEYMTIYEFEGSDAMEQALGAYQMDPNSWAERQPNNDSMEVVGAGWYHEEMTFGVES